MWRRDLRSLNECYRLAGGTPHFVVCVQARTMWRGTRRALASRVRQRLQSASTPLLPPHQSASNQRPHPTPGATPFQPHPVLPTTPWIGVAVGSHQGAACVMSEHDQRAAGPSRRPAATQLLLLLLRCEDRGGQAPIKNLNSDRPRAPFPLRNRFGSVGRSVSDQTKGRRASRACERRLPRGQIHLFTLPCW